MKTSQITRRRFGTKLQSNQSDEEEKLCRYNKYYMRSSVFPTRKVSIYRHRLTEYLDCLWHPRHDL